MDPLEKEYSFNGNELTCSDILYMLRMGQADAFTVMRLTLERLEYLEQYVDDLKTANELKDLR